MSIELTRALLDRVEEALAQANGGGPGRERPGARDRVLALARLAGDDDRLTLAVPAYLGDALAAGALAGELPQGLVSRVSADLAQETGCSAESVALASFRSALAALAGVALPPLSAVEAALRILRACSPVVEASLWTADPGAAPRCVASVGAGAQSRRARAAAREVLASGIDRVGARVHVHGLAVLRFGHAYGALVVRARPADREAALVLAGEALPVLGAALERSFLLERSAARERSLVGASERRLSRLGFDIHDGPIQDVAALAADLRFFRQQLDRTLAVTLGKDLLLGRVDDFEARLVALDRELRELAHSLERSSAAERPFGDALRSQIAAFTTRNDITVKLDLRGDASSLTTSQRLALLAVVREALVNVRDHSGAREAAITVSISRSHTRATVVDNGRGFDVEQTLVQAARRGRLGLIGMSERIRMLGGRLQLESRPGGPTTVSATLPRWEAEAGALVAGTNAA